jgi:hypothetical protein
MSGPVVFVSYAHADNQSPDPARRWLDRLLQHLKPPAFEDIVPVATDEDIARAAKATWPPWTGPGTRAGAPTSGVTSCKEERLRGLSVQRLEDLGEAMLEFCSAAGLEAWLDRG